MSEHTREIHGAMVAILADCKAIGKSQKNKEQGFMYRGIDDVYAALHPLMAKHGVFCMPEVVDIQRWERTSARGNALLCCQANVKYTFWAKDGSCVECVAAGEAMDTGDKCVSKAMAIAHKYALCQALLIPTGDDPDAECHTVKQETASKTASGKATEAQRKRIRSRQKAAGISDEYLHDIMREVTGCESSKDLLKSHVTPMFLKIQQIQDATAGVATAEEQADAPSFAKGERPNPLTD